MQIVGDAFAGHFRAKRQDGEFGMELETEVLTEDAYPDGFLVHTDNDAHGHAMFETHRMPMWKAMTDGSLRNYGIEYVFKKPYTYKAALLAIDQFGHETCDIPFIGDAPATSTHVHLNMYNETFLTLGNFCTNYTLFENVLQEFAGPSRRSNLFSLPTRCSEPVAWNLCQMFKGLDNGDTHSIAWDEDQVKYSALNIAPLALLGSIESRAMRGVTDPEVLKEWLTILYALLTFSRTEGLTPKVILSEYKNKGVDFLSDVFGKSAKVLADSVESPLQNLIDRNLYYAGIVSVSVKDWNKLGDSITPREEKKVKKIEDMIDLMALEAPRGVRLGNIPFPVAPPQRHPEPMMIDEANAIPAENIWEQFIARNPGQPIVAQPFNDEEEPEYEPEYDEEGNEI